MFVIICGKKEREGERVAVTVPFNDLRGQIGEWSYIEKPFNPDLQMRFSWETDRHMQFVEKRFV
ncbi:MAG TPA: hypothetical protein PKJ69_08745 [Spirochaetota bacterium]|nr:hypothetical protein [Spirochaetota bacterium]HQL43247.1 hypothetical protein [Spirochaetota bacterium]